MRPSLRRLGTFSAAVMLAVTSLTGTALAGTALAGTSLAGTSLAGSGAVSALRPAGADVVRDPIVFVHGYTGSSSNWGTMIRNFKADGYTDAELHAWDYDSFQSNVVIAEQLADYVARVRSATGAASVDVVAHSMGGLNSRQYLKFGGGTSEVDDWVSLGSPHHGTTVANTCFTTPCREMRPGSDFLTTLNDGDETPGGVAYGSWRSPCDEMIDPKDSPVLTGAKNVQTACISHTALITDTTVYTQVRDFVA